METSWLGRDMPALVDCITGVDTVQPYGDVALRVIMRIADLLMGKTHCFPKDLADVDPSEAAELHIVLMDDQQRQYQHRKDIELSFWADKPRTFFQMLDEAQAGHMRRQHSFF